MSELSLKQVFWVGIFCPLLGVLSCNLPRYSEYPTVKGDKTIIIEVVDTFWGDSISKGISNFSVFDHFYDKDSHEDYFLVLSPKNKSFVIFNLTKKERVWERDLFDLGFPDELYAEINSVNFLNFDSILLASEYKIFLLDTSGVYYSLEINQDLNAKGFLRNLHFMAAETGEGGSHVFLQQYCSGCKPWTKSYFRLPVEVKLNLKTGGLEQLPITYPPLYTQGYFGFGNHVSRTSSEGKRIYSFALDPNIYIFDENSGKVTVKGGRSSYQLENAAGMPAGKSWNSDQKLWHLNRLPFYSHVLIDEKNELYYRFFLQDQKEKNNEDGSYNTWVDKRLFLMVFDRKFRLLSEVELDHNKMNCFKSFVTDDGIFLFKHQRDSDKGLNDKGFDFVQIKITSN